MQRRNRQSLGHLARHHQHREVGIGGLGQLQSRERIETRHVVVGHHRVDRPPLERPTHASFVLDPLGPQRRAVTRQRSGQQVKVEFGILDDQQTDRGSFAGGDDGEAHVPGFWLISGDLRASSGLYSEGQTPRLARANCPRFARFFPESVTATVIDTSRAGSNSPDNQPMTSDAVNLTPHDRAGLGAAQECALIEADLERLKALINDASERLLVSFNQVAAVLPALAVTDTQRAQVIEAVHAAVTALQFQDMATQLTGHAQLRLSVLEERLRSLSDEAARGLQMGHTHPVRQVEMTAGSIDLF